MSAGRSEHPESWPGDRKRRSDEAEDGHAHHPVSNDWDEQREVRGLRVNLNLSKGGPYPPPPFFIAMHSSWELVLFLTFSGIFHKKIQIPTSVS